MNDSALGDRLAEIRSELAQARSILTYVGELEATGRLIVVVEKLTDLVESVCNSRC